ncbi:hypothetical protein LCGC14_1906420 [marine sediment metagenome]|uniref:Uncharacterized protein n=1 Tax=marine sediment metagenome TaxID=412755 RepID=A0A0F9I8Y7_9ZZZZ
MSWYRSALSPYSSGAGSSISLSIGHPHISHMSRRFLRSNVKVGCNNWKFDDPHLRSNGCYIGGVIHDMRWAWHHLQPDLPANLQFIASFYDFPFPWKHLNVADPAVYGICDVWATDMIFAGIIPQMKEWGILRGYEQHVLGLEPILCSMSKRGMPVDATKHAELAVILEKERDQKLEDMQILVPDEVVTAEYEKPVDMIAFFKWISYMKICDNDDPSFWIAEETLNPESELAKKSRTHDTREEVYPDNPKMFYSYHKSFNFVVEIQSGPSKGMVAAIRLHGGGFNHGQQWWNRIERAGEQGVPIYGISWVGLVKHEVGPKGEWEQFRIISTSKDAFIPEKEVMRYSKYFADATKALKEGGLGFAKVEEEEN